MNDIIDFDERLIVAVCTKNRPVMLSRCLNSLRNQILPKQLRMEIVVVENDCFPSSVPIIEKFSLTTCLKIHYFLEMQSGIPFARNRAIDECCRIGSDWIALIDDDEAARPDWILNLHSACQSYRAEVANGPVNRIYEKNPPHWWKSQALRIRKTGTPITEAPTNNILMSSRIVSESGLALRFDHRLTFGAEDIDFFRRANANGAKMIWVEDAYVDEDIPASRVSTKRLLSRLVMAANSGTQMAVLRNGPWNTLVKFFPKLIRRSVIGLTCILAGLPVMLIHKIKGEKLFFYGVSRCMKAYGNFRGLLGIRHFYYNRTDGF